MPVYVYKCKKCGHRFELKQPFGAKPPKRCPSDGCGGKVVRVFTPPAIIFKGPGFHVTDYGRGGDGKARKDTDRSDKDKPETTEKSEVKTEAD